MTSNVSTLTHTSSQTTAQPPSLERILSADVLADTLLHVTLRRRRFVLLVGLVVGLAAPWLGHSLGFIEAPAPLKVLDHQFSAYDLRYSRPCLHPCCSALTRMLLVIIT